jgi:hypothetical protein
MDHLEGFKMYLAVAEKNGWGTLQAGQESDLFEKFLPYRFRPGCGA